MMSESDFHILTTSLNNAGRTRVLKHSNLFVVYDEDGDISSRQGGAHGLYLNDMRHLSALELRFWKQRSVLLSSTVVEDNSLLTVDLTNPELVEFEQRKKMERMDKSRRLKQAAGAQSQSQDPVCSEPERGAQGAQNNINNADESDEDNPAGAADESSDPGAERSEERRVGKERRRGWGRYAEE